MASLIDVNFNITKTLGGRSVETGKWEQVAETEKGWEVLLPVGNSGN